MLLYRHREGKKRSLPYRFIAWIGLYSYGIYLWHISVVSPVLGLTHRLPHWFTVPWQGIAPTVAGALLGILFTKLVEFPVLRLRDKFFLRRVDSALPATLEPEHKAQYELVS